MTDKSSVRRILDVTNSWTIWTSLSKIGNSATAKLCILAPFIGYLIIFNSSFKEFFQVSGIFVPPVEVSGYVEELDALRLNFLYFGLLSFGIGSAIFSIFAPRPVSHFKSPESFILEMEKIKTISISTASLRSTVESFFQHSQGETSSPFFDGSSLSFPDEVQQALFTLGDSIFLESDLDIVDEGASEFHTGSGYLVSDRIIELLRSGRAVDRVLWSSMYRTAFENKSKDVFYLEFISCNYSRVVVRHICGGFFLLGIILLLIPTILTSYLIVLGN